MILLILISILLLFLIGLLVLPIRLILDSDRNTYFIEIPVFFRVQIVPNEQLFYLRIRLFFIPIKIKLFNNRKHKVIKPKNSITSIRSKTNSYKALSIFPKALKLFTIKKAMANIDTGNFPLNAQLIPVAQLFNGRNIQLQINFENRNTIDIEIITQLYKLVWLGLTNKFLTSKK